jgi:hypothetical protein
MVIAIVIRMRGLFDYAKLDVNRASVSFLVWLEGKAGKWPASGAPRGLMRLLTRICLLGLLGWGTARAGLPDHPFLQDAAVAVRNAPELGSAAFHKLCVDRDGVPYVLTDHGVARVFKDTLALDRSFRPLTGKVARDIALGPQGDLYYLFDQVWLSNGDSGKPLGHLPRGEFSRLTVANDGSVLLSGAGQLAWAHGDSLAPGQCPTAERADLFASESGCFALADGKVWRIEPDGRAALLVAGGATTLAQRGAELLIGAHDGYYGINPKTGALTTPLQTKLPVTDITCIVPSSDGVWFGTRRGVFFLRDANAPRGSDLAAPRLPDGPNRIRYYASRRWLKDDSVLDLALDGDGHLWALTQTGLSKIEFRRMTLAEKADYFDRKVRSRHVRFGLTGERRLPNAGDIASSEIVDTDNDGGWSSYYLASQAFRFAVTGSRRAWSNAWEVFAALERLQSINPLPGFPARTFERAGFKYSDPDRWREVPGGDWEWKGHTSSDEVASQAFAHAALWECVAKTEAERQRVAANFTRIVDHILRHNGYLVDVDGRPTLWGRWNPEYVNRYPPTIFDRRLNSAEIIASLQLAWHMTDQEKYRQKANELFQQHGYLTNILSSMHLLKATLGYIHQGNEMGDEWNHSDDELAFVTYWVLYRFAFDDDLRVRYAAAIREHWQMEAAEQYPFWNFIYAGCGGGQNCDPAGAVWTLRGFPLDTITWRITNSPRKDLTRLEPNFMRRELKELLPPGERPITRCNTQPFILDGGDGGHTELPGDEFLLGYWLGRYLKLID